MSLVELYTSEGCSSCPPAEAWLGELQKSPDLWRRLVPVNFHVDYWDGLGWPDRFADREYSERQHRHVRRLGLGSAYTPGFVVNGAEWRGFFEREGLELPAASDVGSLRLVIRDREASIRFRPTATQREALEVELALLGFGLANDVTAGENRGRRLVQNFVVLGLSSARLERRDVEWAAELPLPVPRELWPERAALADWVSRPGDPSPVQAVGGYVR